MEYDRKSRIGHKAGWICISPLGYPVGNRCYDTRKEARQHRYDTERVVKALIILAWNTP